MMFSDDQLPDVVVQLAYLLQSHRMQRRTLIYLPDQLIVSRCEKGKLTEDKESFILGQLVVPVDQIMP